MFIIEAAVESAAPAYKADDSYRGRWLGMEIRPLLTSQTTPESAKDFGGEERARPMDT